MMTVIIDGVQITGAHVAKDTRDRMVRAAVELFRERGYAATSFSDVIERSGAPRGSIYHHFPRGKEQLAAVALGWYAEATARGLQRAMEKGSAADAVAVFVTAMRDGCAPGDFRAGCPIAAVTLDVAPGEAALLGCVAAAFESWRRVLADAFRREGATPARARRLASFVVAAVEGALILARAERDVQPLTDVAHELAAHVQMALAG
jgi:TetR/AcrR family transcriptional regulator, lmrAB and yxaGH operons repressor